MRKATTPQGNQAMATTIKPTNAAADAKYAAWMADTNARAARFAAIQAAVKAGVPLADAARAAGLPLARREG
jgi:hypothetical protein